MNTGLLVCALGAIAFGLLGCASKVAERKRCDASALIMSMFGWATLLTLLRATGAGSGFQLPWKGALVAVACGICAVAAYFAFQTSIRLGKVTIGWLMMNLSAGVPALVSIWLYNEKLTLLKTSALLLAGASVFLLFWGHRIDERTERQTGTKGE
ncbi:MAG: EamA family transporter [Bryobacteraceae bacterium]